MAQTELFQRVSVIQLVVFQADFAELKTRKTLQIGFSGFD
jgi:hypothetical protein